MPQKITNNLIKMATNANRPHSEGSKLLVNANILEPQNQPVYYFLITIYCILLILTGSIVILSPQIWLSITTFNSALNIINSLLPGLIHLASFSDNPQDIVAGYCLTLITFPLHLCVTIPLTFIRYRTGFIDSKTIATVLKGVWIFPVGIGILFFTTLFATHEPSWQDLMFTSSQWFIAIFGQGFIAASAAYPSFAIIALYDLHRKKTANYGEE